MKNTKVSIAERAGLSISYVTMILNGQRSANKNTARLLEAATGTHRLHWLYPAEYDEAGNPLPKEPAKGAPE